MSARFGFWTMLFLFGATCPAAAQDLELPIDVLPTNEPVIVLPELPAADAGQGVSRFLQRTQPYNYILFQSADWVYPVCRRPCRRPSIHQTGLYPRN